MRFIYTRTFAIFSSCLVLVAILVFMQSRGYLFQVQSVFLNAPRPIAYVAKNTTRPLKNFFSTLFHLRGIVRENVRLTGEVVDLKLELARLEQVARENDTLRAELGYARQAEFNLEACSVLAHNPLELTDTIVLSCGTERGIAEGQAVISQGHLVGKVLYAGKGSATALLITNSKFSADAQVTKNGTNAIIRGSFGSGLFLEQVPQNVQLEKGWQVVTAGINEKIPRNIAIGEVGEVLSGTNDLFKKASILSPVDFENLEFVFVVK